MVKHTQTIRRQIDNELFEYVWPFCGIGAWVKFDIDYFSSELSRQLDSTFCSVSEIEDCEKL